KRRFIDVEHDVGLVDARSARRDPGAGFVQNRFDLVVVLGAFSGASSCNGFDALRRWAAALAIVALWGLLAGAPAFADDQRSDCKPMPDNPMPGKVAVDAAPQINIGVLVNAFLLCVCDRPIAAVSEPGSRAS